MKSSNVIPITRQKEEYPSSYREVKIGNTVYCVTSIFLGEKDIGKTLESLAVQHVLQEMRALSETALRAG